MKTVFIIGGARSGKSSFALREASKVNGRRAFIATAEALDDEMRKRIDNHILERGSQWDTFEEPLDIISVLREITGRYKTVVLDCLTIWLSNLLAKRELAEPEGNTVEETIKGFIDFLTGRKELNDMALYLVSNEVGMGIVPENKLARRFRDLAGRLNQSLADAADEVYLVTAGIPVRIK